VDAYNPTLLQPMSDPFSDIIVSELIDYGIGRNAKKQSKSITSRPDILKLVNLPFFAKGQNSLQADAINEDGIKGIIAGLEEFIQIILSRRGVNDTRGVAWIKGANNMIGWLSRGLATNVPPYAIFAKGNAKLPYWQFSALAGITCPSAGACLAGTLKGGESGFCYSFSAWRYPAPFFRQMQNTLLIRTPEGREWIRTGGIIRKTVGSGKRAGQSYNKRNVGLDYIEAEAKAKGVPTVVRLYVDGDMDTVRTVTFWMDELYKRPMISAYGYSKSWAHFISYDNINNGKWPDNYTLNLSGGSIFEDRTQVPLARYNIIYNRMKKLAIAREGFIAYDLKQYGYPDYDMNVIDEKKIPVEKRKKYKTYLRKKAKGVSGDEKAPLIPDLPEEVYERNRDYTKAIYAIAKKELGSRGLKFFACTGKCGKCLPAGRVIMPDGSRNTSNLHACGQRWFKVPIVIGVH